MANKNFQIRKRHTGPQRHLNPVQRVADVTANPIVPGWIENLQKRARGGIANYGVLEDVKAKRNKALVNFDRGLVNATGPVFTGMPENPVIGYDNCDRIVEMTTTEPVILPEQPKESDAK